MGATVHEHSFDDWWRIMETRETGDEAQGAVFFHPVCERAVIAGAATIGEEIIEDLPEVETVLIPIGGGGLACGIAQAVRRHRPDCRILAVETDTALPLQAALRAGKPVTVERTPSFIDGMGSTRVLDAMWPLLERLIDDVVVVTVAEVEEAIRRLAAEHHVIAEGAGRRRSPRRGRRTARKPWRSCRAAIWTGTSCGGFLAPRSSWKWPTRGRAAQPASQEKTIDEKSRAMRSGRRIRKTASPTSPQIRFSSDVSRSSVRSNSS